MKKKVLQKLLALTMCTVMAGMSTGCGSNPGNQSSGNSQPSGSSSEQSVQQSTSEQSSETATPEPTPEAISYDFGGRTFRIGSYYDMAPNPEKGALEEKLAERIKFVEDNYNCTIEFVNLGGDYVADYVTTVLAGAPCVDIGYVVTTKLLPDVSGRVLDCL